MNNAANQQERCTGFLSGPKNIEVHIQKVEEISRMLSTGKRSISFQRLQMIGRAEMLLFQLEHYEERLSIALDQIHQALEHLYH
jgi:hypothetical protein